MRRDEAIRIRQDRDPALEDHVERAVAVSLLPEQLTVGEPPLVREGRDPRALLFGQLRESLIVRKDCRGHQYSAVASSG